MSRLNAYQRAEKWVDDLGLSPWVYTHWRDRLIEEVAKLIDRADEAKILSERVEELEDELDDVNELLRDEQAKVRDLEDKIEELKESA